MIQLKKNLIEISDEVFIPIYKRDKLTDDLHDIFPFRTDKQFITKRKMREIKKFSKNR